jgi:uncharacterized protein (TIGR02391 family)
MAAKRPQPAQPKAANLTADQMQLAIPKLKRRIDELDAFDPGSISERFDPRIGALEAKLEDTLAGVFGEGTQEYNRHQSPALDQAPIYMGGETSLREVQEGLQRGKDQALINLRTVIELFEEKLGDGGETPAGRARRAFGDLDLHSDIAARCSKLFEDGHYSQAVETACKVLDMMVQYRSMRDDLNGTALMRTVFSPKAPILKYNDQQNETEKSEQEGMMHLFEGAMLALRNPRAHGMINDHPERAIEYLSFLSMLAKSLDRTQPA